MTESVRIKAYCSASPRFSRPAEHLVPMDGNRQVRQPLPERYCRPRNRARLDANQCEVSPASIGRHCYCNSRAVGARRRMPGRLRSTSRGTSPRCSDPANGTVIQPTTTIIHDGYGHTTVIVIPRQRSYLDTGPRFRSATARAPELCLPPGGDPGRPNWFFGPDVQGDGPVSAAERVRRHGHQSEHAVLTPFWRRSRGIRRRDALRRSRSSSPTPPRPSPRC